MAFPYGALSGGEALAKLRLLPFAVGPSDQWRAEEDRAAAAGNTLSVQGRVNVGFVALHYSSDLRFRCRVSRR